jgi:hypothetical protein
MSDLKAPADVPSGADSPELEATPVIAEKSAGPPNAGLAFVIIGLLAVLVFILWRANSQGDSAGNSQIAALQAEIDAHRASLERERAASGSAGGLAEGEAVEAIAERIKRDTDSLALIGGQFEEQLRLKDAEISSRDQEISRLEAARQGSAKEVADLHQELKLALAGGPETERLGQELAAAKAELAALREEFKGMSAGVAVEDFEDLKRRFEETSRAKEFFEARVKELEKSTD